MPLNNLPFGRNVYFSESGTVLDDIAKGFKSGNSVALTQSIVGTGGFGKTQTALEYAFRNHTDYERIWWVSAENPADIVQSYKKILRLLDLIKEDENRSDIIIETFLNWLNQHKDWLCIYDNLEELDSSAEWWPKSIRGHVLVTTRNQIIGIPNKIKIEQFTDAAAVAFLEKRTNRCDPEGAKLLAKRLGNFPLALEQAGAYIANNSISYNDYLTLLDEAGLEVFDELLGVVDYKKTLTATVELSIQKIDSKAALELLTLYSYFAPENIDPAIFRENREYLPSPLSEELATTMKANKLWLTLTRNSLLSKQDNGQYSMHRLLQEVVRAGLGEDKSWARRCLALFCKVFAFEYGNVDSHNNFTQLAPHVKVFLEVAEKCLADDTEQRLIARLYNNGAVAHNELANYAEAFLWNSKGLAIEEKVLGKEHPDTAKIYNNIAGWYDSQGDYSTALEWYYKALVIWENAFGMKHQNTAIVYNNIATMYDKQGCYSRALEWYNKALVIWENTLGKEHSNTATLYNNMAGLYCKQGDYPNALEMHYKALAIREKDLGKEHPSTAETYNNIAWVYNKQGDYPKALEWHNKALPISEEVLGKEHPVTATMYNNIAVVHDSQGDYSTALEWYNKALAIWENALGKEHLQTAAIYNNIGLAHAKKCDYATALVWFKKALPIRINMLGSDHEYTQSTRRSIQFAESRLQ